MNQLSAQDLHPKETDEAVFSIDEVFMSRTDTRGVIIYANEVFRRVSGYQWDELIAAPHKVMRHPDMPKAVFQIFWDELKAGRPIGSYVKNRCKSGGFYWVFAVAVPVKDGFLSIRFKPTSPMFDMIVEEYAKHRDVEKAENLNAEDSAERFQVRLKELGYDSYQAFMASALATELEARMEALQRRSPTILGTVHTMLPLWGDVNENSAGVFAAYEAIRITPLNMQTQAGKMNDEGKPLAVIATNFGILSDEMAEMMGSFEEQSFAVLNSIYENVFLLASMEVLTEAVDIFKNDEMGGDPSTRDQDMAHLTAQAENSAKQSQDAIRGIVRKLNSFVDLIARVRIILSGLSMTRVMCEIEAESLGETHGRLAGILNELQLFQSRTDKCMHSLQTDLRRAQRMLNGRRTK